MSFPLRLAIPICLVLTALVVGPMRGASDDTATLPAPTATLQKYCYQCHSGTAAMGGVKLDQLVSQHAMGRDFQQWQKVVAALDQKRMPPRGLPQPSDAERSHAAGWVRAGIMDFTKQHDGDPGRVTMRRLTSGEYAYAIHDLTGIDIDTGIDAATDSVGGEGFTNFGDVQFIQDASLERYLAAAKNVADHAVIGSGPLGFYSDPGSTGFEFSAVSRIRDIYEKNGFRVVSGEGGFPFGLERYGKAFYAAWAASNHRASIDVLATREGIQPRFARHILSVMTSNSLGYPASEAAARWRKIPANAPEADVRKACADLQKYVTTWPLWLFARGDAAVGGAGDESPLIINDVSLKVNPKHHFNFNRVLRKPLGSDPEEPMLNPTTVFLNVESVTPGAAGDPLVLWRNATIAYRKTGDPVPAATGTGAPKGIAFGPKQSLQSVVTPETAAKLKFGEQGEFVSSLATSFQVPVPAGVSGFQFQVDAEIAGSREHVLRIVITDRPDGTSRGIPVRKLIGDQTTAGYRAFKSGVLEFVKLMPPNSQGEATPADKDPIPDPFDSTYNVPEHDDFVNRVKYLRDDRFVYNNILDDASRVRLDHAWNDLFTSFGYHDNYLDVLAQHYKVDVKGKHVEEIDLATLPEEMRKYAVPLKAAHEAAEAAQAVARPRRLDDCLQLASMAWRRPLTENEKRDLRSFYDRMMTSEKDHRKAIRALLTRILVSPAFLYRVEQASDSAVRPLTQWETASRLSFFLWSSVPDETLRQAALAGELGRPEQIRRQVKRMVADPRAPPLVDGILRPMVRLLPFRSAPRRGYFAVPRVPR